MSAIAARVGSAIRVLIRKWESLQVELHGSYSMDRFLAMEKYRESTSVWRAIMLSVSIPLIPLVCVAIVDALPMSSPDLGLAHSGSVWARGMLVGLLDSYALSWMFCLYVPELQLSKRSLLFTAIATAAVIHLVVFGLIMLLGYPLPFTLMWMGGPWIGALALSLKLARGDFLRRNPGVQQEVRRFSIILLMQMSTTVVYVALNVIFQDLPDDWQMLAALLVPVFKITERNLFCRYLNGKDDVKPEMVVFGVEMTKALFISSNMQQATSIKTSVMLALIDLVLMLVSLLDLSLMLKSVKDIADKMGVGTQEVIETALLIATQYPELKQQTTQDDRSFLSKSDVFRLSTLQKIIPNKTNSQVGKKVTSPIQVAPSPADIGVEAESWVKTKFAHVFPLAKNAVGPAFENLALQERLSPQERHVLLGKALKIMFLTEFLLLIEFMEIMTPVLYSCYLVIIFHWPNREYYPQLQGLNDTTFRIAVRNIFLYGMLEVASFLLLVVVIYRTTHRFPFQQLAYALKCSWGKIQCKLVIWLVLLLQATIPQLGTDYTFKFEWMHRK